MLDLIGAVLNIAGFLFCRVLPILLAVFGIMGVIMAFKDDHPGQAVIAIILGIVSVVIVRHLGGGFWITTAVAGFFLSAGFLGDGGGSSGSTSNTQVERGTTLTDAIVDTYCEYELAKAAAKDAIREEKNR